MEHNAKKLCISGKEQNLNKQMTEFGISILFEYFMYILAKCHTFSRSCKPILQFNTFPIPRGKPEKRWNLLPERGIQVFRKMSSSLCHTLSLLCTDQSRLFLYDPPSPEEGFPTVQTKRTRKVPKQHL